MVKGRSIYRLAHRVASVMSVARLRSRHPHQNAPICAAGIAEVPAREPPISAAMCALLAQTPITQCETLRLLPSAAPPLMGR